jgi:alpha-beta hydrolase superfamily lysophospholipase
LRSWKPVGSARAIVVVVHGFNAHSGYYEWVGEQLTGRGLAVYALDLPGRGKSEGERFYVNDIEDYAEDVDDVVNLAKSRERGRSVFLLGHSAGGVVACIYSAAMVRADERLKRAFPQIALPVLIMHGTDDEVTKPSGSQFFYDTTGSADKTLKMYPRHFHDLLNDLGKEAVVADIQEWIATHLSSS